MSETLHYGRGTPIRGSDVCPRCQKGVQGHKFNSIDISDAAVDAVAKMISVNRANVVRGKQDELAESMVGALVATTKDGLEVKLVAASGPGSTGLRVPGWDEAAGPVPRGFNGWTDIHGRGFSMPTNLDLAPNEQVGKPCAAVKMLVRLGALAAEKGYVWKSIHLYEEPYRGADDSGKKVKSSLRSYQGQGTTYTYAAHSCHTCHVRIPLLLCDRPVE